jgi:hypothetical protein
LIAEAKPTEPGAAGKAPSGVPRGTEEPNRTTRKSRTPGAKLGVEVPLMSRKLREPDPAFPKLYGNGLLALTLEPEIVIGPVILRFVVSEVVEIVKDWMPNGVFRGKFTPAGGTKPRALKFPG